MARQLPKKLNDFVDLANSAQLPNDGMANVARLEGAFIYIHKEMHVAYIPVYIYRHIYMVCYTVYRMNCSMSYRYASI